MVWRTLESTVVYWSTGGTGCVLGVLVPWDQYGVLGYRGALGDTEAWHLLPSPTMGGPPPRVQG